MLTVVVARPPRFGAKVGSFDAGEALKVPGVVDVKEIPSGVAVYAKEHLARAQGARGAPRHLGRERRREARQRRADQRLSRAGADAGPRAGVRGDATEAMLAAAEKVIESGVRVPLPRARADGAARRLPALGRRAALARFGSQLQTGDHKGSPTCWGCRWRGRAPHDAGRRQLRAARAADVDLAAELAEAAKAIGPGRPVKVVWTREDDIRGGYYRPLVVHACAAALARRQDPSPGPIRSSASRSSRARRSRR